MQLLLYLFTNMTYPGGLWSFSYATDDVDALNNFDPSRAAGSGITTRWYTPDLHRAAFMLPAFIQENLTGLLDRTGW